MSDVRRTDYERIASRYDEDRAAWDVPPDDAIEDLLGSRGSLAVLDLGCGTGKYLEAQEHFYAERPLRLVGVDPSTAMLEVAAPKVPRAHLVRARAEELALAGRSIDYIHTSFAFHHFTDKAAALDEIARVLRDDGRLWLVNVSLRPTWWGYLFFEGAWETDVARFWPVEKIVGELEARHFAVEHRVDIWTDERRVDEIQVEAQRRVSSQIAMLDDRLYEEGLNRIKSVLADDPDATVETESARLELDAVRG